MLDSPLLDVDSLGKSFSLSQGIFRREGRFHVINGVSFQIKEGETLGLVGESGCGKSTLGKSILRLVEPDSGAVRFRGEDVLSANASRLRSLRRSMQMIFQDPFSSLNPRMRVGAILAEPFIIHKEFSSSQELDRAVAELLDMVQLPQAARDRFPHEFSGGQRQRIGIARSLALRPALIIADEPVSALDVSIQSQILNLLQDLKKKLNLTMMFISHDLVVVEFISDHVAVMYLGRIVEQARVDTLYKNPLHPYTQALFAAIPEAVFSGSKRRSTIMDGDVPSLVTPPTGCAFHPRCPRATAICRTEIPSSRNVASTANPHHVACHHA